MRILPTLFNLTRLWRPHYVSQNVPASIPLQPSSPTSITAGNLSVNFSSVPTIPYDPVKEVSCQPTFSYCGWELFKQGWDMNRLRADFINLTGHAEYNISHLWNMIFTCAGADSLFTYSLCGTPEPGLLTECHGPFAECGVGEPQWAYVYWERPNTAPTAPFATVNDPASTEWWKNPGWAP